MNKKGQGMKTIMRFILIALIIFVLSSFLYGQVKNFESSQQCDRNPLTQCMCWSECSSDETGAMDREKTCNIDCGDDDGAVCCYVKSKSLGLNDGDQNSVTSGVVHFSLNIDGTEQNTNIKLEENKAYTFKFTATGDYVNLCTAKLEYKTKPADADKVIESKEQFTCKTGGSIYFEATSSYKQYSPLQISLLSYPKDFDTSRILADPTNTQSQKLYNIEII